MYQHGWHLGTDVRFAVLTLPDRNEGGLGGRRLDLGGGYFLTSELPFEVPAHWKQWLGTLNYPAISEAGAYLMYVTPPPDPGEGFILAGEIHGGDLSVKRVVGVPATYFSPGHPLVPVEESALLEAVSFARVVASMRTDHRNDRLWRMLVTFILACQLNDSEARLHQFVRVVGGLTFSWNKKEFAARTAEFVDGDTDTAKLQQLYALRGKVEHLRAPLRELIGDARERRWKFEWHAVRAETLARYVLWLTLGSDALAFILRSDEELNALWSVAEGPRRAALFTPRLVLSRASSRWETKRPTDAAPSPVSEYPDVES